MSNYVFANAWEGERKRLDALANIWHANTRRNLETFGPLAGLSVLEVGAGHGSVARWLCDAVGPNGRVVATDIDTRFIDAIESPNFEARRHDIAQDVLEAAAYDVVHCRLVLEHLPASDVALANMAGALKPGGVRPGPPSSAHSLPWRQGAASTWPIAGACAPSSSHLGFEMSRPTVR